MPRAARFTISVIEDLFRQLEYAPAETRRRQMDAAERLVADIDPQQNYPEEFITYRVTGYRPETSAEPAVLVGRALIQDLANLVLRLSHALPLKSDGRAKPAVMIEEAARRLNVSTKTLQRYRKQGLVCHAMTFDDGVQRVACYEDALERFVNAHQQRLQHAADFTRIDHQTEAAIIEEAREMRSQSHASLNEAAQSLAQKHGRSHETIRQLLRRHDRQAARPIFAQRGPLDERAIKVIHRAWQRGIEPVDIARHFGKSKATIHRAINRRRFELLRRLDLSHVTLPTFDLPDARKVILSPASVRSAASDLWPTNEALTVVAQARDAKPVERANEEQLIAAGNLLIKQCADDLAKLGEWPGSDELDSIETNLRWAGAVRMRLVWLAIPAAIRRIEQNVGRPIAQLPRDEVVRLVRLAMQVCARAAAGLDVSRGQRLERAAGYAMDMELARKPLHVTPGRAAARHAGMARPTLDPQREIVAWHWLLPPVSWRERAEALDDDTRRAVKLRFGWNGGPPMTCDEVATAVGVSEIQIVRRLREAMVRLRRAGE